jgi:arsenite methyltransferase
MTNSSADPTQLGPEQLREAVRGRYAAAARRSNENLEGTAAGSGGSNAGSGCCTPTGTGTDAITRDLYPDEAAQTSTGALAASLGCGNPTLLADLQPGQTVLDLGSGGGLDVLLSARRVAPTGKAYGLDMTPEMLDLARRNQREAGVTNAEFLAGTIENVPLRGATVDVVISNCVINLAADKDAVFSEAFRVLRPGGRLAVSDIVLLRPLPEAAARAMALWTGCVAGALLDTDYVARLSAAGFTDAAVEVTRTYARADLLEMAADLRPRDTSPDVDVDAIVDAMDGAVASAFVRATKAT